MGLDRKWTKFEAKWLARFFCFFIVCLHTCSVDVSCVVFEHQLQMEPLSWKCRAYPYQTVTVPNGTIPWNPSLSSRQPIVNQPSYRQKLSKYSFLRGCYGSLTEASGPRGLKSDKHTSVSFICINIASPKKHITINVFLKTRITQYFPKRNYKSYLEHHPIVKQENIVVSTFTINFHNHMNGSRSKKISIKRDQNLQAWLKTGKYVFPINILVSVRNNIEKETCW